MTAAPEYGELHRLVDRLTPDQVRALRAVARELVRGEPQAQAGTSHDEPVRQRSFAGIGQWRAGSG
jgi:hypothetical protein